MRKSLCLFALVCLLAACQRSRPDAPAEPAADASTAGSSPAATTAPEKPKPVPATLPEVIARVHGQPITRADLEEAVKAYEEMMGVPVTPDERDQVYRGLLDDLVTYRVLDAELERRTVDVESTELEDAMKELRDRFPSDAEYRRALKEQQITVQQLRERTRNSLRINKLLEQEVGQEVAVTPGEIARFYEENPDRFRRPEAIRLSHILIGVPQGADADRRSAARERAADLAKRARAGADFARLARSHSDDASRERGGDLGFIMRGQAQPAFEAAAFALEPGEISDPVETVVGFHVIKAGERRPSEIVPFGQAAAQVEDDLLDQRRQERARAFVERLKASGGVEILM